MKKRLFTTSAINNIDHNPTASTYFHGTSISIFQQPNSDYAGEELGALKVNGNGKLKKVPELNLDKTKIMLFGTH